MDLNVKLPSYVKVAMLLIGLYLVVNILSIIRPIILPVIYAVLISVLVAPAVHFLVRKKVNRTFSVTVVFLVTILLVGGLLFWISLQLNKFGESWPQLTNKFQQLTHDSVKWTSGYFSISTRDINAWISDGKSDLIDNSGAAIGTTIVTMGGILAVVLLTPVYTFMILNYEPHLVEFIHRLFGIIHNKNVSEILMEVKSIIRRYLVGLSAEFIIIVVLNALGLFILGIDYPILLGIIGALLNIIPYIGGLIGVAIFMLVAFATKSPIYVVYVVGLYALIQFIDNNYIIPKIIGGQVKLNPLICIIAVIVGAALWGIPGMFLSIPFAAILKLTFDRIDSLRPWGFLMGDTTPLPPDAVAKKE
ncbi:AI-2E family transporter [uncultured Imperialibacter sp.]|uniref:AI-2E family transporter n=1 Tax=uncultured Imperialibacter sp. TaxID=1672639 RepID=UPI0030DD2C8D|tara:strand:- start:20184 stop:21266 length:1083 start_codon:yes stop_codon:yes gene_type:complete